LQELGSALLSALDDDSLRELASRLRPYLSDEPGRLLDAREASDRLGLHTETLVRMARHGRVWAVKVGREWRFRADRLVIAPGAADGRKRLQLQPSPLRRYDGSDNASVVAIRGH
jgi:excisionase family DNA binding protein